LSSSVVKGEYVGHHIYQQVKRRVINKRRVSGRKAQQQLGSFVFKTLHLLLISSSQLSPYFVSSSRSMRVSGMRKEKEKEKKAKDQMGKIGNQAIVGV
jgi:hypothetical protein